MKKVITIIMTLCTVILFTGCEALTKPAVDTPEFYTGLLEDYEVLSIDVETLEEAGNIKDEGLVMNGVIGFAEYDYNTIELAYGFGDLYVYIEIAYEEHLLQATEYWLLNVEILDYENEVFRDVWMDIEVDSFRSDLAPYEALKVLVNFDKEEIELFLEDFGIYNFVGVTEVE